MRIHACRRRPYRVECTGSLPTSEVKRRRARLVLGWGTAWEHLRVLSAFGLHLLHHRWRGLTLECLWRIEPVRFACGSRCPLHELRGAASHARVAASYQRIAQTMISCCRPATCPPPLEGMGGHTPASRRSAKEAQDAVADSLWFVLMVTFCPTIEAYVGSS